MISNLIGWFLHLDTTLGAVVQYFGAWSYGLLFLVIFCETGLVVTPFLPGDSLLFAAGTLAAAGAFNPYLLIGLLMLAAVAGDSTNYWLGRTVGLKALQSSVFRIKKEHLEMTRKFYDKYGPKTVVLMRYVPIVRTVGPFVAGVGRMRYPRFLAYSIIGTASWVGLFVLLGYFFGNLPVVRDNFSLAIMAIILISIIPGIVHYLRERR
jgi:membrane-associated protein